MTTDRMRALDAVEAPDQWADIVRRAGSATASPMAEAPGSSPGRPRRALVLAAALILVAVAIVGAVVLRSTPGPDAEPAGPADGAAAAIWGHRWQLVRADVAGASITQGLEGSEGALVLDTTTRGRFVLTGCPTTAGTLRIRDGRLEVSGVEGAEERCGDPLASMLRLDGATARVVGDELVLRRSSDPEAAYTFVRSDAVSPSTAFWGHRWRVASVTDRAGDTRSWEQAGVAPILDAVDRGLLRMEACRIAEVSALFEGERLVARGPWETTGNDDCVEGGADDVVRAVFTYPDVTTEVDGRSLVVRSTGGELRAQMDPLPDSAGDGLFGHEWTVAAVEDGGEPVRVPPDFVLTAGDDPRSITVPGCATEVGGPATSEPDDTLTVDVAPPNPRGDCGEPSDPRFRGGLALADWFRDLLAEPLSVVVLGDRASILTGDAQVALVRRN